jgi:hypothetical protein
MIESLKVKPAVRGRVGSAGGSSVRSLRSRGESFTSIVPPSLETATSSDKGKLEWKGFGAGMDLRPRQSSMNDLFASIANPESFGGSFGGSFSGGIPGASNEPMARLFPPGFENSLSKFPSCITTASLLHLDVWSPLFLQLYSS